MLVIRREGISPAAPASSQRQQLGASPHAEPLVLYERSDTGSYRDSFVAFLALGGFEVWGLSQRVQDIPPGTCESSADCSVFQTWGLEQLLDDLDFVRSRIADGKPHVGGLSLGSIVGYAAVNRHPQAFEGVIAIDGAHYQTSPEARAYSQGFCGAMSGALAAGVYFDASIQQIKALAQLELVAPDAPSPVPGFPPGFTNRQVFALVTSQFQPSPIAFTPGFIVLAGDAATGEATYSNLDLFARATAYDFVDYTSVKTLRDLHCSLAGLDDTWYRNLSAFSGNIFIESSGRGFGQSNLDVAALATAASRTTLPFAPFGHVDAFYATFHRLTLELPLLLWLRAQ